MQIWQRWGISAPTAKQWLSILVPSGFVVLIEPYFNNALKTIIGSPNVYFLDTGLCACLTRWDNAETLEVSAISGEFFENYVVSKSLRAIITLVNVCQCFIIGIPMIKSVAKRPA